ncbi:hypothetical protein FS749_005747 [Ceratobasidium sp. UAMH 11750]|nr:hypothetical protein FS749_005747 [Ceratobasidium sp. UAMH 11750]
MLDLQGHQVEVHGEQMSNRDRRDARRVETSFTFGSGGRGGRGGPRGGYRGEMGGRPHANEPPGPPQPPSSGGGRAPPNAAMQPPPQPGPPPGSAPHGGSRRAAFGSSLTVDAPAGSAGSSAPAPPQEVSRPTPTRTPEPNADPETLEQHSQFLALLNLHASTTGVTAIRGAIRSFKASESSARDMVATIFTVLDENMNTMSTIINALVPLFEEEKRREILNSWNGMKIEASLPRKHST